MDSFGFLLRGRIELFPLLALPFALGLKMVALRFVPSDNTWQTRIFFLMVLLQMTQICSHSVNRLSLCQLMQNPLCAKFLELQVIFDIGIHGAMANADLNTNLFLCDLSVFRIRPSIHTITSGVMARWACSGCELSYSDVCPSCNLFCHSCTLVRDIQCSSYTADIRQWILCSSTLSHQETNHMSLLFFPCLHIHTLHYAHLQSNK